jgi:putative addiction module component (TIGR02574 family)
MSELAEKLIQQALGLPADERAEVAERLLSSLEPTLTAIDQLLAQEAEERVDIYERDEIEAIPAEDVFNAIKNRSGKCASDFSRKNFTMTENAERVKQEVLLFSEADRAEIARFLIESLDESEDPVVVEAAWDEELRRRVTRIEQGKSQLHFAHEVLAEVRDKYK